MRGGVQLRSIAFILARYREDRNVDDVFEHAAMPGRAQPTSRRRFFKVIGFGMAGGALLAAGGRLSGGLMAWMFPAPLVRSSFAARLGDTFQVYAGTTPVGLRLVKVTALNSIAAGAAQARPGGHTEDSFAVLFRGPRAQPIAQGMYDFAHSRIGSFPLFIVPMAAEQDARYYEAIFNRQRA